MGDLVAEIRIQHIRHNYCHENSCDFCCTIWPCDAIRAVEETERLLEALEFYADEKNWRPTHVDLRAHDYNLIPACLDHGKIARAALYTEQEKK